MVNMQQMPAGAGQGGKAAAPQGKQGAPAGKGAAPGGKQGGAPGAPPAQMVSSSQGQVQGGAGQLVQSQQPGAPAPTKNFPMFSPGAQGHHGASSAQQNPNQGGASSSKSSITDPSTRQGGMGDDS